MSSAKLDAIKDRLAAKKTRAFLVLRNDKIVYEWYAPGVKATTKQGTESLAKALVGGMSLAVAISDGKISIDEPASKFVPQWKSDPLKSKITIREVGSHTSGMDDAEADEKSHEILTGWKGDFWKRLDPPRDPFTIARDETPVIYPPGTGETPIRDDDVFTRYHDYRERILFEPLVEAVTDSSPGGGK